MTSLNQEAKKKLYQTLKAQNCSIYSDMSYLLVENFKAINGIRPRWWNLGEWSLDDLRAEAQSLEDEVVKSIEQDKRDAHERMLEANRVALIHRNAKKPVSRTFKPFANLKEMLV